MENRGESAVEVWSGRLGRQINRMRQLREDLGRAASWHLGGGRESAYRNFEEWVHDHTWCFIVACNNSGTSLLQRILENSGEVSTFPLEGQRYTRTLVRGARRGYERVWSEFLSELRLTEADDTDCRFRLLHDWMRELGAPTKPIIVEKTTMNSVRMRWLQRVFPKSVFIGLVRNGFAVSEGIMRKGNKSALRAATHWNLVNSIMLDDAERVDNFLLLRYEDLVMDQDGSAETLAEFLKVPKARLSTAMTARYDFSTVNGSGMQPVVDLNAPAIARLSSEDYGTISRVAAETLNRLGYEQSSDRRDA